MNNLNQYRTLTARLFAAALLLPCAGSALADVRYVDVNSTNATPPYTNWTTAATNIQDAVDTAVAGDEIVVTNGFYATGWRATVGDSTPNRVAVDKPLMLRSVNGPQSTTIDASRSGRCAYLTNGASLSGFTLTNGSAWRGAGLLCETTNAVVSNCVVTSNGALIFGSGEVDGAGVYGGTLNNCTLSFNYALSSGVCAQCSFSGRGGGAFGCTLNNCTLIGNSVSGAGVLGHGYGGGAFGCTLNNCTLTDNNSSGPLETGSGGGAFDCTLDNCTLIGNSAPNGGGASSSTLNNCTLTGNYASGHLRTGSGASSSTLNNCTLTGNAGLGASGGTLNNCTLTGNSGGGASGSTLNNCIVYFNTATGASNYDSSSTLNYCCTTPQPTNGVGNISLDPQLASSSHLSSASPCRGAGNAAYASGTDIDGEAWASPPSIGCDEYHAGAVIGPLNAGIAASFTNVTMGFTVQLTALIEGRTTASSWDFCDGITVTNQPYTSHAWAALGDYAVVLRAYNESQPGGISATVTVHVVPGIHYVAADSANPAAPYTSWTTAATNIQDAINEAIEPGAVVMVTNGLYAPVVAHSLLTVRSVNGPQFTVINGAQSNRCAFLANDASQSGFTLTNGVAQYGGGAYGGTLSNCTLAGNSVSTAVPFGIAYGGGAYSCTLNNCTLTGNYSIYEGGGAYRCTLNNCALSGNSGGFGGGASSSTLNNCTLGGNCSSYGGAAYGCTLNNCTLGGNPSGYDGGGAYGCTLNNCTLAGNSASHSGGGAFGGTLNNCTLTGNSAGNDGGGAFNGALNNCIVYFNTAAQEDNYDSSSTVNYSCTTPPPTNGFGNITNTPLFVDRAGGNLRLQSNSPCINAGLNALAPAGLDLDGNPRISGGTVDIGAYEFVFTPEMNLGRLILLVEAADLGAKHRQPLLATLNAALASLTRGNATAANHQLLAFQNQLRAQVAPWNPALAEQWSAAAQQMIAAANGR